MRFTKETFFVLFVFLGRRNGEFQGYKALELRILGLVNDTHAAPAEFGEDMVWPIIDANIVALPDTW